MSTFTMRLGGKKELFGPSNTYWEKFPSFTTFCNGFLKLVAYFLPVYWAHDPSLIDRFGRVCGCVELSVYKKANSVQLGLAFSSKTILSLIKFNLFDYLNLT